MYSTDDDLFETKRAGSKKWKNPKDNTLRKEAAAKPVLNFDSNAEKRNQETDSSSDDFANKRNQIWTRKQLRPITSFHKQSHESKSKKESGNHERDNKEDSETDFEFKPKRGAALLAKRQRKENKKDESIKEQEAMSLSTGLLPCERCSSCSESICQERSRSKEGGKKLLQRITKQIESQNRNHSKHPMAKNQVENSESTFSKERRSNKLAKNKPERTTSINKTHIKCMEHPRAVKKMILSEDLKAVDSSRSKVEDGDSNETFEDVKEFIGGQLRKGIEKAIASAVMKLNEKLKNEAESSNERMELLMKGLMNSYHLISNKVSELTHAYTAAKEKKTLKKDNSDTGSEGEHLVSDAMDGDSKTCSDGLQEVYLPNDDPKSVHFTGKTSVENRSRRTDDCEFAALPERLLSEPPRSVIRPQSNCSGCTKTINNDVCESHLTTKDWLKADSSYPEKGLSTEATFLAANDPVRSIDGVKAEITARLEFLEDEVCKIKERMASSPDSTDLRAIRRLLDDYDEKAKQCWNELTCLRNSSNRRRKKTDIRIQQLIDEVRELQSSSVSKEDYLHSKLTSFAEQVPEIKESIEVLDKAREKAEAKLSSVEHYTSQIYDACKSTLKGVDLRYQKIKKCYQETREQQRVTDAKCNALAESLAILHQKQKR
eukprot:g754.t1